MPGALVDVHPPLSYDAFLPTSILDFQLPPSSLLPENGHISRYGLPAHDLIRQQALITQFDGKGAATTADMGLCIGEPPSDFAEKETVGARLSQGLSKSQDIALMSIAESLTAEMVFQGKLPSPPYFMDVERLKKEMGIAERPKKEMGFRSKLPSPPDLRENMAAYDNLPRSLSRMGGMEQEQHSAFVGLMDDDAQHACNLRSFAIDLQASLGDVQAPNFPSLCGPLRKFLPSNNDSCTSDDSSSDEFRMYVFKVRKCVHAKSHDWTECPFAHHGEKARRRDPRGFHYSGTSCPDYRKGSCKRGDYCELAHGIFECWLHPARYRTQLCKDGKACTRRVCFFAHSHSQLRVLSPRTAPSFGTLSNMSKPVLNGRADVPFLISQWGDISVPQQVSNNGMFGDGYLNGLGPRNFRRSQKDGMPDALTVNERHKTALSHASPFTNLCNELLPSCTTTASHGLAIDGTFESFGPTSRERCGFLDEDFCPNQQNISSSSPSHIQRLSAHQFFDNGIKSRGTFNYSNHMSKLGIPSNLDLVSSPTSILTGQAALSPLSSPAVSPSLSSPSPKSFASQHADFLSHSSCKPAAPQPSMDEVDELHALLLSRLRRHRVDSNGYSPLPFNTSGKQRSDSVNPMLPYEASHIKCQNPPGEVYPQDMPLFSATMQPDPRHFLMEMMSKKVRSFHLSQSAPNSPKSKWAGGQGEPLNASAGAMPMKRVESRNSNRDVGEQERGERENPDIGWITDLIQ